MTYSELLLFLRSKSYVEVEEIHNPADFAVKGDTIICWLVTSLLPTRVHFFGEDLEKVEFLKDNSWELGQELPELLPNILDTPHGRVRPGEYLVHPYHGVGIFQHIETRKNVDSQTRRFVVLQYAGNDTLLIPLEHQDQLMPYIGSRHPRLTRLYSKSWLKTTQKVQKDLIQVARELLKIYAARQLTTREPYPEAAEWLELIAAGVPFNMTEDQEKALQEIHLDFSQPHPMDRLICGDVGFGKTEVAIRAATQVIAAGKQVALIAPTTVLAEQHYALLKKRFASLPVTVEHISRLTVKTDKQVKEALAHGGVDIVVGTHRLLGRDINFKNLGLLILDEEQKFGVAQKEWLKELRPAIDVLSLSATPIPRTLSMSLSGLRSLSILRTAPQGRKAVETVVKPFSNKVLAEALDNELRSNGQVYVVHNRVQSLGPVQKRVSEELQKKGYIVRLFGEVGEGVAENRKEVVVATAHGQMSEIQLAKTMAAFMAGDINVLVASSIVEHGLDSPGANTLIVLHSEWFGLSDLYQLRGRVGRRQKQAQAYFFLGGIERASYEDGEGLLVTQNAQKRLAALKEADVLGSGWSIALRDLEIRGGGNILGHEQHGSMEAIGLLLYAQLLQEEIGRQAKKQGITLFQRTEGSE